MVNLTNRSYDAENVRTKLLKEHRENVRKYEQRVLSNDPALTSDQMLEYWRSRHFLDSDALDSTEHSNNSDLTNRFIESLRELDQLENQLGVI